MARYKIIFAYDGTSFAGFQKQPNQRTVEGVIEKAVNKMAKKKENIIGIYASGRTDAGVHALAQVAHFDFPFEITEIGMLKGLNSLMPLDIQINDVKIVSDDFHARYQVTGKKYIYRIDLGEFTNPFKRNFTTHWRFPYKLENIKIAINDLIGEHDFSSFVASGSKVSSNIRYIYDANVNYDEANNELIFQFYGNGFLYNQVRIMVGVLMQIGQGKRPVNDIQRLLKLKNRQEARLTMGASGLYLKKVYYPGDDPKNAVPKTRRFIS